MAGPIYSNAFANVETVKDCILVTTYFETNAGEPEVAARIMLSKFAALTLLGELNHELRASPKGATVTPIKSQPKRKRP